MNITLSVDDEVVRKVRKLAIDKRTTLTQLIRDHLEELARRDEVERQQRVERLGESFVRYQARRGDARWRRDDLHER